MAHAAPDVTMAASHCSISAILAPTLSCSSYMLAKSCAVELIASSTSGSIKEPERKVMVTLALIIGVTPSSANKSLLRERTDRDKAYVGNPAPTSPPRTGTADSPLISFLLLSIGLIASLGT